MKKHAFYFFVLFLCTTTMVVAQQHKAGKKVALTSGAIKFTEAKWSPDGTKVAFTEQGHKGIYVTSANNPSVKKLVDDLGAGYKFAWNPSSTELAYRGTTFTKNIRSQYIATVNCKSLTKQIIVDKQPAINHTPTYIIDEENQVLMHIQQGKIKKLQKHASDGIKEINSKYVDVIFDNGNLFAVTKFGENIPLTTNGQSVYPVMSPDKSKVVYSTNDELVIMNLDGSNKINLGKGYHPSFSPDGKYIVYHIASDDGYFITSSDLYVIDIDGNNKTQLTNTPNLIEEFPDWSPNGNAIVFNELQSGIIYKMELK